MISLDIDGGRHREISAHHGMDMVTLSLAVLVKLDRDMEYVPFRIIVGPNSSVTCTSIQTTLGLGWSNTYNTGHLHLLIAASCQTLSVDLPTLFSNFVNRLSPMHPFHKID